MAVIQPNEIAGLPELFDEVKTLRQELELLKAGVRLGRSPGSPIAEPQSTAIPIVPDDEPAATDMSAAEIRERVGRVVGQQPTMAEPNVAAAPKAADDLPSGRPT